MIDADGSADPGEIPRFVAALLDGADFAKGTRFADGGGSKDLTRLRSFGNYALTALFNVRYGRSYSDLCYGFNVFWRRHLPVLGLDATSPQPDGDGWLWGDGFEVQTLIHVRVAKAGLVVAEVPSFEHPRIHGARNLNAFRDGRCVLQTILAERHPTRRQPAIGAIQLLIPLLPSMTARWCITVPYPRSRKRSDIQTGPHAHPNGLHRRTRLKSRHGKLPSHVTLSPQPTAYPLHRQHTTAEFAPSDTSHCSIDMQETNVKLAGSPKKQITLEQR